MPTYFDDFKLNNVTCEIRYKNAYLIYDRTGQVVEDLRDVFTNITVVNATPPQSTFTAEEGTFVLELGACRLMSVRLDRHGEAFSKQCKAYFDTVASQLRIDVFTRIGLRYIARKEFNTLDEPKAALSSLMLANLKPVNRFNRSDGPTETMFRWEDKQVGALFRLKAETIDIKATIPQELREHVPKVDKKIFGLTLDIDYYTVSPVEREQWNAQEWILEKLRIIKKETDGILQGGR